MIDDARPQGGRAAPCDERAVPTAVVYALTSGWAWRHLPPTFDTWPATAHRRFTVWITSRSSTAYRRPVPPGPRGAYPSNSPRTRLTSPPHTWRVVCLRLPAAGLTAVLRSPFQIHLRRKNRLGSAGNCTRSYRQPLMEMHGGLFPLSQNSLLLGEAPQSRRSGEPFPSDTFNKGSPLILQP
ncbi:transposase [Streptomyces sp. QH1-20]|uniref:transposase n=1 Tax=Streptomyces sp. QH1-20 TaxID=3240934 RepID=UPI003518777B